MIKYEIISTGSKGNATVLEDIILIDCGVSLKVLKPKHKTLNIVLLTHRHSDHFKKRTIRLLAQNRPMLRFGCCQWLVPDLLECGVNPQNIDIYDFDNEYDYGGKFTVIPVPLVHDVPNCGYKIHFASGEKVIYATDTNNLNGINAPNYDLYMIEGNYSEDEIKHRISEKR